MQLLTQPKKYKEKTYNYYSIAESYRDENNRSNKRILFRLGKLSDDKADKIRKILAITKTDQMLVTKVEDLLFKDQWAYLDVVFLDKIWNKWGLGKVFPKTDNTIPTSLLAEILTINRCLRPASKNAAIEWFPKTVLPWLLKVKPNEFNKNCVYRGLSLIENQKNNLEKHLAFEVNKYDPSGMRILFYDLTASYFEGTKCKLAKPGFAKSAGYKPKQIVLALLINRSGYPLMWEVLKGGTADVDTIENLVNRCKTLFNYTEITLVFDRGMVSNENLIKIDKASIKYISALDKDQIAGIVGDIVKSFECLDVSKSLGSQLIKLGFTKYDRQMFYKEIGIIDNRRYVLGFNPELMVHERNLRIEHLNEVDCHLEELNTSLREALKSRKVKPTEKKVEELLKKFNAKQLIDWRLEDITIEKTTTTRKGVSKKKKILSFKVCWSQCLERIAEKKLLDGLCLFVSNHKETTGNRYSFCASHVVSGYREKNEVENAFREIKSFIDFRPVYVRKNEHVKAHYTVCVLSYLLNITVRNIIQESDIIKNCYPTKIYDKLGECNLAQLGISGIEESTITLRLPSEEQINILKEFGYVQLTKKPFIKKLIDQKNYQ